MPSPDVTVAKDPNMAPVRAYENGLPVHRRQKKPVLCQNRGGSYRFVPEDLAKEGISEGKLIEMTPDMPDFIKGVKLAIGIWDGFKPGEVVQMFGEAVHAEDLGKFDADKIIKAAEKTVEEWSKGKRDGIITAKELPPGLETFDGKARAQRFPPKR